MGSQTNRGLAAKADRAKLQRQSLAIEEYSKPAYHVKPGAYDTSKARVVRVEAPIKAVVRIAYVDPVTRTAHRRGDDLRTVETEVLVSARIERAKPLTGKRAELARLKQHW